VTPFHDHDLIKIYEPQIISNANRADALSVLEDNLGATGLRKCYAIAFERTLPLDASSPVERPCRPEMIVG
jgi:hypothetical protein